MGPDDTTKFGNTTIRWGAGVAQDVRDATLAKMQAIKPSRPRRTRVNHELARKQAESRGAAVLARTDAPEAHERANLWIRVYYRSMGGEILAFEHGPLRSGEYNRCRDGLQNSDSLGYDVWQGTESRPVRSGARVVVLPSQRAESVVEHAPADVPMLALVPEPTPVVAPVDISATLNRMSHAELTALSDRDQHAAPNPVHLASAVAQPVVRRSFYAEHMARRAARRAA